MQVSSSSSATSASDSDSDAPVSPPPQTHPRSDSEASDEPELIDLDAIQETRPTLGLGASRPSFNDSPRSAVPQRAPAISRRGGPGKAPAAPKIDRDFGKFMEHSGGAALKMMTRMGYTFGKGLGKNKEGIVNPIDTKLRPGKMGLAYRGFQEKTKPSHSDELKRYQWKTPIETSDGGDSDSSLSDTGIQFRKATATRSRKEKVIYQTADELISRVESVLQREAVAQPMKIIDMRGPEVREVTDWADLKVTIDTATPSAVLSDLTLNDQGSQGVAIDEDIRLIMDLSRADMDTQQQEDKIQSHRLRALNREREGAETTLKQLQEEIAATESIAALTTQLEELARAFQHSPLDERMAVLSEAEDLVLKLHVDFAGQWSNWHLEELAVSLLASSYQTLWADWVPREEPDFLLDRLTQLRPCMSSHDYLYPGVEVDPSAGATPPTFNRHALATAHHNSIQYSLSTEDQSKLLYLDALRKEDTKMTPYESFIYHLWLPPLRSAIVNEWQLIPTTSSSRSARPSSKIVEDDWALRLLELWKPPLVPCYIYHALLDHVILPKLRQAVDNYQFSRSASDLHVWLHPWLPILGTKMTSIIQSVHHKLGIALKRWHPSESYGLTMLSPWKYLITKYVLPKLKSCLRNEFTIDPRDQKIDAFEWVTRWHDLITPLLLGDVIVTEFFPQWHHTLQIWLAHSPDFEQVMQWYLWWKSLFPEALAKYPKIAAEFRNGVDVINRRATSG
ncbi:GC-rich sequence DNA-binding factor-like protein-domain-containing protein [Dimargaris cristalligena]|uniref:GC-rich sequence DNA-binding factor-like protein-domain-containing protein n=1 Tax=Dimargaris cristalligena TaxID=215637 RepID=A0A4P9ZQA8_9FUNG|nr:GC-rich sequence DNA-binding factor-like protein-domain-containing protein [Dimargaris cristalligena]|eukprot:RKP34560.1 GC-rich sequence DNA-binding factor-like protein-domain-containing protein [Dimargaris cristalligena]